MSATTIGYDSQGRPLTNGASRANGVSLHGVPGTNGTHGSATARGNGRLSGLFNGHPNGHANGVSPEVGTGRLDVLVPHLIRSRFLRPGFVRLSLWLGIARQMPSWAKLQFLNHGVARQDLESVLGRVNGLESWADAWEKLGLEHERKAHDAEAQGDYRGAGAAYLQASAAYNFSQYV